jgi:hypothetical protein
MDGNDDSDGRIVWRRLVRDIPGRVVITDPERRRILNPGPSPECLAEIERLDRMTRRGRW